MRFELCRAIYRLHDDVRAEYSIGNVGILQPTPHPANLILFVHSFDQFTPESRNTVSDRTECELHLFRERVR